MKQKIYLLSCEDASNMGGPMGSEYTTHLWTKPFTTIEKAKDYAEQWIKKYHNHKLDWTEDEDDIFCDALSHGFDIKEGDINENKLPVERL